MRKIILSMFGMATLSTPTLTIVACNNDTPLEITDNDIYGDTADDTSKINNICIHYANTVDKNHYSVENLKIWYWNIDNRLSIIGKVHYSGGINIEYWKFTLQKTKSEGIFVTEFIKSDTPI